MRSNISFYKQLFPLLSSSSLHFQFLLSPYKLRSSLGISKPKLIIRRTFKSALWCLPRALSLSVAIYLATHSSDHCLRTSQNILPNSRGSAIEGRITLPHLPSIFPQEDVTASRRFQCADTTIVSVWHCLYLGLELHSWNNNQR